MDTMTTQLWIILGIAAFFGVTSFWIMLSGKCRTSTVHQFLTYLFFLLACITWLVFNITANYTRAKYEHEAANQSQVSQPESESTQAIEIAAVDEYETNKQIAGDRAWWINLSTEKLKEKCQAIAIKMDRDWQSLVDLLSGKNATLIISPH